MIDKLKKLTDGLIVYSALVSDFELLDFKSDALAGVRANYFNSSKSPQSDKTEVVIDSKTYNLSYYMRKNEPLSWKITRNNKPYQSLKRTSGDVYCVIVYGENDIIYKRIYFDNDHNWLRTEYYDNYFENVLLATLYPKIINDIVILRLERIDSNGDKIFEDLFPSNNTPKTNCTALIYSNAGMLWYDKKYKPKNFKEYDIAVDNSNIGFNFKTESFNSLNNTKDSINLVNVEYLDEVSEPLIVKVEETVEAEEKGDITAVSETTYSAYDKIEKILSEAHKSNKDLFGEVINLIADTEYINDDLCDDSEELDILNEEETIILDDDKNNYDNLIDSQTSENIEFDDSEAVIIDSESVDNNNVGDFNDVIDDIEYKVGEQKPCNVVIHTKSGKYSYYGAVDENNCRSGKGRTITPEGNTSYEGEYKNDKRDGFGVCYYNEGNINYVGNWTDGNRNGCGVGYRLSDGTMHIGKWDNNNPVGLGARFDKSGNFIDISSYLDGQKDGKSISFDENGNIIIRKYKNGELISEKMIIDEDC